MHIRLRVAPDCEVAAKAGTSILIMRTGWRRTLHGEWIRDHVGLVAEVEGRGWYGYPFRPGLPRGPYMNMDQAMEALEEQPLREPRLQAARA
jgi:hypothetical protein